MITFEHHINICKCTKNPLPFLQLLLLYTISYFIGLTLKYFFHLKLKTNKKLVIYFIKVTVIPHYCANFAGTWLHDKRKTAEGKIEMQSCTTSNCHNAFSEASLHDLRNGTIVRDIR